MYKHIIILFLLYSIALKASAALTYAEVDSITYQCFQAADWDKLIVTGEQALKEKIDFKTLRQRLGYAFFKKGNYYASQKHYEKALEFDKYDAGTHEYLYYCGLNTGNEASMRYHAARLTQEQKEAFRIKAFKPLASIDLEFNYKSNTYDERSNPTYFRLGLSSYLGSRFSLYQSVSVYNQMIDTFPVQQPDYFAMLKYSVTPGTTFTLAYHYLNTNIDGYKYPGNLVFGQFSTRISRFELGVNGSYFKYDLGKFSQVGVHAKVTLPGKQGIYLKTSLNEMIETSNNRLIFSQTAGIRILKSLWGEGQLDIGNIQNYCDHNALYVYNSLDPTVFRTGASLFWGVSKKITFYGNYLYDSKKIEQTTDHYIQHSFLTGIIWKL